MSLRAAAMLLPLAILALHAAWFGDWIVDDAAISFAYAKNFAHGLGLVPQPGVEPVEGYSNPLWVLTLSPLFWLGWFHPVWTPKLVSLGLVSVGIVVLQRSIHRFTPFGVLAPFMAATLLATQTGVVAWMASGLENGLYFFCLASLFAVCLAHLDSERDSLIPLAAGVLAAACALTRPEGVIFLVGYPVSVLVASAGDRGTSRSRALIAYGASAGIPIVAYLTLRTLYFGEWLPNTYLAKGGPRGAWALDLLLLQPWSMARLAQITESIVGWRLVAWVPLLVGFTLVSERNGAFLRPMLTTLIFLVLGAAAYVLLPPDWMPEFRFGTPFYLFFAVLAAMAGIRLAERLVPQRRGLIAVAVCGVILASAQQARTRSTLFVQNAPIPLSETLDVGRRFQRAAEIIGEPDPSLLFADIGGLLLSNSVHVVDLGMLCDREIATYLGEGSDKRDVAAFHDYVFEDTRPTFIATRAYHSWIASLDSDQRFRRDYVAIREYEDTWIRERYDETRFSGDYVRRDRVSLQVLEQLRTLSRDVRYAGCADCSLARLSRGLGGGDAP